MDGNGLQINKQKNELTQAKAAYSDRQKAGWETTDNFHKTAKISDGQGGKYSYLDNMDMRALLEELNNDPDHKSYTFTAMRDSIDNLTKLAASGGRIETGDNKGMTADFFETLFAAKQSVNQYLYNHAGFRWTSKGDRRVQISLRLRNILNSLDKEIAAREAELDGEAARKMGYLKDHLNDTEIEAREKEYKTDKSAGDIKKILETGLYGDNSKIDEKTARKMSEQWVIGGYTDKLTEMINGLGDSPDSEAMDDFLAYLEDQNNRMLAGRMAIQIMVDNAASVTQNIPSLQTELKRFVTDSLSYDDMLKKPDELATQIRSLMDAFSTENADRISKLTNRRDSVLKTLHLSSNDTNLYNYPFMTQMLTEQDDAEFDSQLNALKERTDQNDRVITDILLEQFSIGTRASICKKLFRNMGALRVFGTEDQIRDQTYDFINMLKYTAPQEYMAEKMLSNVMKDLKIDSLRRDSFLIALTDNKPEMLKDYSSDVWKIKGEQYSKRHAANIKSYAETVDKEGLYLTEEQWDELEKKSLESGVKKETEFKKGILDVTKEKKSGKQLSRREYLSKRKFNDAKKEPARILRAREERKLIDSYGDDFKDRFILNMTGNGTDPYALYRNLDAAYKGNKEKLKVVQAEEQSRFDERVGYINRLLQKKGYKVEERKEFTDKCKWMISGIYEITEDMTDDERLKCERMNLERFGVLTWEEALSGFENMIKTQSLEEIRKQGEEVKNRYDDACRMLEAYDGGKYAGLVDLLVGIPEVYSSMMNLSADEFNWYAANTLDVKLKNFMDGMNGAKEVPDAVRKQYAFSYLRNIYDGKVEGDTTNFTLQISDYYRKVLKVEPAGGRSIEKNLKDVENYLDKDYKKRKIRPADAQVYKAGVMSLFYDMMNDTASFELLFDKSKVMRLAKDRVKEVEDNVSGNVNASKVSIEKTFTDVLGPVDTEQETALENIKNGKIQGIKNRVDYLGVDVAGIEKIRLGKSLVRVGEKGSSRVSLNTGKADSMRVRIQKLCGNLDLPPVLRDALIEEGASEAVSDRLTGIMWSDDELIQHATSMNKMYQLLRKDLADDAAMSDEEAQMYIVRCYGDASSRKLFAGKTGPDVAQIRKDPGYKTFRADYAKLKQFEAISTTDPSLGREHMDMARNLRTILVTGVGIAKGSNAKLSEIIDKNIRYMERAVRVEQLIREQVDKDITVRDLRTSDIARDRRVFAFRQYFLSKLIEDCKQNDEFDPQQWKKEIEDTFANEKIRDNMEYRHDSVSNREYAKATDARIESGVTEGDIAAAIRANTYLFKGRINKYEKLDQDQKKFFALALVLMDKGSIGMDTAGTSDLLNPKENKAKDTARIEEELAKYVAGQPYSIEVDYKEAFNKLINYGETKFFYMEGYALSVSAYDKALQFARAITAKKQAFGEKDTVRMTDGVSSINAAYTKYGKDKPQQELEKLRDEYITADKLKDMFKEYADADAAEYNGVVKKTAKSFVSYNTRALKVLDETLTQKRRMQKISKRFSNMNDHDLRMFIRIMQERTLIDRTTITSVPNGPEYADQEKRNALMEALCADSVTRSEVLSGFDDNESCHKAIISALSFQLRDDLNFKGKELTRGHFAGNSLKRKTAVDWDLIERAFDFIDEVKERRASVYALQHASDYIEQSGNKKAIEENRKLENQFKDKDKFTQKKFEKYIKIQAEKDAGEESDAGKILAGYHSLTDKEKSLFFKVLARRDLLDISKKDYKKSFFGIKDRNYVNQADRDKLIDQYIESSLEDNIGIVSQPGDFYDALKSLFSTQISDREKFNSDKDLKKMKAAERRLFMGRTTAIDWKLFRRALNFVNRATEELEYREGNAQLYRGAGMLSETGKLSMNYSFLRKNFHSTGNQWGRYLGRFAVRTAREELKTDDILNVIVTGINIGKNVGGKIIGLSTEASARKGLNWLANTASDLNKNIKAVGKSSSEFNISKLAIKDKEKTEEEKQKEKEKEQERRENLLFYDRMKEGIDTVIAQSTSATNAAKDVAKFIRDNYATRFEAGKTQKVYKDKAEADENNTVVKMTKGTGKDNSYGDIRDSAKKGWDTKRKVVNTAKDVSMVIGYIPGLDNLQELAKYACKEAALKFLNEKIIGVGTDFSGIDPTLTDEEKRKKRVELLNRSTQEYAQNTFKSIVEDVVGKENVESVLEIEQGFYDLKETINSHLKAVVSGINYTKKCVNHVKNVAKAAMNISTLSDVSKIAKDKRDEDEQKLAKAEIQRLSPEQAEKVEKIVKKHRGMSGLSEDISTAVLSFGIAEDVINLAFETAEFAGGKLNVGGEMISKAVKAGIEFAMYAVRIATDRNALHNYFLETEAGAAVVDKVRSGFVKTGNDDMVKRIDKRRETHGKNLPDIDTSLIDIISDVRGYEHTSELVENTGMSMAQSLVFSASKYNPMAETRLIAITVMSIMGLTDRIGDTSPETVEKLFLAFKMKR